MQWDDIGFFHAAVADRPAFLKGSLDSEDGGLGSLSVYRLNEEVFRSGSGFLALARWGRGRGASRKKEDYQATILR